MGSTSCDNADESIGPAQRVTHDVKNVTRDQSRVMGPRKTSHAYFRSVMPFEDGKPDLPMLLSLVVFCNETRVETPHARFNRPRSAAAAGDGF
jgi:hypothetical protein